MVTKLVHYRSLLDQCSVLAKIHMVTKLFGTDFIICSCSVLAKIHMVTKPQKYGSTFLNVIEY